VAQNHKERLLRLVHKAGLLRPRDLQSTGIPSVYLTQLVRQGKVLKTGRGLYVHARTSLTENHSLAEAAKLVPKGVVCLLSALRFHELTTQLPSEVWLAIPPKARRPRGGMVLIRPVHFSGDALTRGVEIHDIENVSVRIYN